MTRPLTFREVIDVLLDQGAIILCFRCKHTITKGKDAEREHLIEKALGGDDSPANARISHKDCHAQVTNGNGATTAGSSKNRIAKANNPGRKINFVVNKQPPGTPRPPSAWASRKLTSGRKFPPRGSCPMNRKRRA